MLERHSTYPEEFFERKFLIDKLSIPTIFSDFERKCGGVLVKKFRQGSQKFIFVSRGAI